MSPEAWLDARREAVDRALERLLPAPSGPARRLAEAMRYAVLGGGKRLRPLLVLAGFEACGGNVEDLLEPAAAVEMIHAYSLAHDDLPAMDDDDLRRGRATLHRAFDEAAAILAGDALVTLAFEILGGRPAGQERTTLRAEAVVLVARAGGVLGMCGGQMADLEAEGKEVDLGALEWIHRHKTGSLIAVSAELGAVYARASASSRSALSRYGQAVGLAFQIADDLLDQTATATALGKTPGKDRRAGKATYPALLGAAESRRQAHRLVERSLGEIAAAGIHHPVLEHLARLSVARAS